ncbi:MAG: radical SAM protein, partial [Deltaproteobacteria bacterium]|nr:radical SAM protein [Deltaproteobacteria bacterium]
GIRRNTELICDTLGIEEADLFCLTCAVTNETVYREIHAVANLNLCIVKILKERFPGSFTMIGGLTPESHLILECRNMLERCPSLDFTAVSSGETPILNVIEHVTGKASFEENNQSYGSHGNGFFLETRDGQLRRNAKKPEIREIERTLEKDMAYLEDPDVSRRRINFIYEYGDNLKAGFSTPFFDPGLVNKRRLTGIELMRRCGFPEDAIKKMAPFHDMKTVTLPVVFIIGCNGGCAFCCYSNTMIVCREIREVIYSIAYLKERYGTRNFQFLNSNINGIYEYADAFCDALIKAKLDILWPDSVVFRSLDERLLDKMQRSGLMRMVAGVECPSERMLKYVHKGASVEKMVGLLKHSHELSIWNHCQFIAGIPTQTDRDLEEFLDFLEKTVEYMDAYNINDYHLAPDSLMALRPEKYRIKVMEDSPANRDNKPFCEINGLAWEEKKNQIKRTQEVMTDCISRHNNGVRFALDLELLSFLYNCFGHGSKREIREIYRSQPDFKGRDADLNPSLAQLLKRLKEVQSGKKSFAGYILTEQSVSKGEILVALNCGGETIRLLVSVKDNTKRYYAVAGEYAVSYLRETPIDTEKKNSAVRAFTGFMKEGI